MCLHFIFEIIKPSIPHTDTDEKKKPHTFENIYLNTMTLFTTKQILCVSD